MSWSWAYQNWDYATDTADQSGLSRSPLDWTSGPSCFFFYTFDWHLLFCLLVLAFECME